MIGAIVRDNMVENLIVLCEAQVEELSKALSCEIVDARPYGLAVGDLRTAAGWTRNAGGEQSEQMVELRELRNAKNTWKKYFINNWFMFDEEYAWVVDYLGMSQYYKYALRIDEFDSLFKMSADEIEKAVSNLSAGQKRSVSYRAKQLIASKEIDSLSAIEALERSLGIELIEKPEK